MRVCRFAVLALVFPIQLLAQTGAPASPGCPVQLRRFYAQDVRNRVRIDLANTSGKPIVGLTFNAALADATEHWKWLHLDHDDTQPLREFGWNKTIKPGQKKDLSWDDSLEYFHGGGAALVLTSVLFADGTRWEAAPDDDSCTAASANEHKKRLVKPVDLPPRPLQSPA
jgi:hypothetical protein